MEESFNAAIALITNADHPHKLIVLAKGLDEHEKRRLEVRHSRKASLQMERNIPHLSKYSRQRAHTSGTIYSERAAQRGDGDDHHTVEEAR